MSGKVFLPVLVAVWLLVSLAGASAQELSLPAALGAVVPQAVAPGQWYLYVTGVVGEAMQANVSGWIVVQGCAWSLANPAPTGTPANGVLSVAKGIDCASPLLYLKCAAGTVVPAVTLQHYFDIGGNTVCDLEIDLANAHVSSVGFGGTTTGAPGEQVSFTYAGIRWLYSQFKADGSPGPQFSQQWGTPPTQSFLRKPEHRVIPPASLRPQH
jgi:type VI secretion system Hcp family effector